MDNLDGKKLSDLEQWSDENGHVLGVKVNGKEKIQFDERTIRYATTHLILFRAAIDVLADVPDEIEVGGVFDGKVLNMTWKCSICGCVKKWYPGNEIVKHLAITYLAE